MATVGPETMRCESPSDTTAVAVPCSCTLRALREEADVVVQNRPACTMPACMVTCGPDRLGTA